jgi:hypothetical protein
MQKVAAAVREFRTLGLWHLPQLPLALCVACHFGVRTAVLHVVLHLPLGLYVACQFGVAHCSVACRSSAAAGSMCRLPVWRCALLCCMLYLRCRWVYMSLARRCALHGCVSFFSCRWVYVSFAMLALRTALLHVVPLVSLVLCVACQFGVAHGSVACCTSGAAGSMFRLLMWRCALLGCLLCLRCRRSAAGSMCRLPVWLCARLPSRGPRMWGPTLSTNLPGDGLTSACLALRSLCSRACSSGLTELEPPRSPLSSLRSPGSLSLLLGILAWPSVSNPGPVRNYKAR